MVWIARSMLLILLMAGWFESGHAAEQVQIAQEELSPIGCFVRAFDRLRLVFRG